MGQKRFLTDYEKSKIVKVFQKDAALLKLLKYWDVITEPSNVLLQMVNRVARNVLRK